MRFIGRIGLAAFALTLALAAGEAALRVAGYQYSPLRIDIRHPNDWRDEHAFRDRHFVYDPVLIWRPRPGLFSAFNVQGVRGAPLAREKGPGTIRLVALGDSNTFGWVEDDEANWPAQLQMALRPECPGCEVANAGVWGYTSFQGLRRFRETLALDPDIVLVSFGANDAHPVTIPDAGYVAARERAEWLARASARVRLAQLVTAGWDRVTVWQRRDAPLGPRVPLDEYEANLRAIVAESRARGVGVVLLTRPFIGTSDDPAMWKTYAPQYNAVTRRVARDEGVALADVFDAVVAEPALFADESHFTEEGHRRAGAFVAGVVAPLVAARRAAP